MRRTALALSVALAALVPSAALAQSLAVAEAEAYHRGITREELKRFRDLYTDALRKAGANVTPAYGRRADLRGVEFVTSLSVGRVGEDYLLTAQVSRIRLDRWASRAEARARLTDGASIAAALDQLAGGIVSSVRSAPPRVAAQPPRKARESRVRQGSDDPSAPMTDKRPPRESVDIESPEESSDDGG